MASELHWSLPRIQPESISCCHLLCRFQSLSWALTNQLPANWILKFHFQPFGSWQPVHIDANSVRCQDGARRILPQQARLRSSPAHGLQGCRQLSHWIANTPQFIQVLVKFSLNSEYNGRGKTFPWSWLATRSTTSCLALPSSVLARAPTTALKLVASSSLVVRFRLVEKRRPLPCGWIDRAEYKLF